MQTHTTRFAGDPLPVPERASGEILEAAKAAHIRDTLTELCRKAHYELNHRSVKVGETLMVDRTFTTSVRVSCEKCKGTGHWQNPNRETDKRICFSCKGTSFKKVFGEERTKVTLKAGTEGKVVKLDCDADRYGREGFDKWFAYIQVDGHATPVRAALASLTRPRAEVEVFQKQAKAFLDNSPEYAFYAPFKTGVNCIF